MKLFWSMLFAIAFCLPAMGQVFWEWDCSADPTTLDSNDDGVMDWVVRYDGEFDPASLVDGIWTGGVFLDSRPLNDFADNHITADIRFKSGDVGAYKATLWLNVDYTVDPDTEIETFAPIYMHLENDGTSQTLTIYNIYMSWKDQVLATFTELPNDFIEVNLIVDIETDKIYVKIDGVDKGSYEYTAWGPANTDKWATVLGSAMQLDYVRIELGAESESPETWPIPGDATLDCVVNILDLIFVRNRLNQDIETGDNWKANVNDDDKINILDLLFVRNHLNTRCPEEE